MGPPSHPALLDLDRSQTPPTGACNTYQKACVVLARLTHVDLAADEGSQMYRVLIADDHDLVRDGLISLIERGAPEMTMSAVGDLASARRALSGAVEPFDIVLLDLRMPGMRGYEDVADLIRDFPGTKVVLFSGLASASDIFNALEGTVAGFIPKTLPGMAVVSALRLIASGQRYFPADAVGLLARDHSANRSTLSRREFDVLFELRQGRANKEIGRNLGIEEPTVKLHIRSLCAKLEAKNRTDLVLKALERRIID
jgi:two-component system nitrate/nitrite response regulator NarL